MNPKDLVFNFISPSSNSNTSIIDKETQTSKIYYVNLMSSDQQSSKSTSGNKGKSCKDDDIKVFEFCEVIKDPNDDSVSIVKETFTEEVIKSPDGLFCEKPTHNRYKYCREVIQPYCKAFSKACPKYPPSTERLLTKQSNSSQDLSNQQPKQEICTGDKDINENNSNKGSAPNMESKDSKTTFVNPHKTDSKSETSKAKSGQKKRPCPTPRSSKKECQQQTPDCEIKSKCPQNLDDPKFKDYLSSCINTTIKLAKKGSEACFEKCEKVIGIRSPKCGEEKPSYYAMNKRKSETDSSANVSQKSSTQNILESETVKTIQSAVQGLICTVYTKTKDAIDLIKTESCRHLGLSEKAESETKTCESKSMDKVTNIFSDRFQVQSDTQDDSKTESVDIEKMVEPAINAIKKVISAVSCTATAVKDLSLSEMKDQYVSSKFDKSSKEDDPDTCSNCPKKISHDHEPSPNPSVFAIIKTKFFSMFGDNKKCQDEEDDESDGDEQTAETLFDKYCDQ